MSYEVVNNQIATTTLRPVHSKATLGDHSFSFASSFVCNTVLFALLFLFYSFYIFLTTKANSTKC